MFRDLRKKGNKEDQFFSRLLEIVLPEDKGFAVVLEACFDESERNTGAFCVAGYAFTPRQAKRFDKEWRDLFGERTFHMVDLVHLQEDFKGLSQRDADRLLIEAIKIVKKRISFGAAVSCYIDEVNALSPRWIQGFGHAYPVCCHMVMACIGDWLRSTNSLDRVAYFFEQGYLFDGEAESMLKEAAKSPQMKDYYRHHSDTFIPKADSRLLQSADLLAWEWAKCQDETLDRHIRDIRKSLRALFEPDPNKRYKVLHLTGKPLKRYLNQIRNMGLAQVAEEPG